MQQTGAMNLQTLQRVFKQVYGATLYAYYNRLRLELAKTYLLEGDAVNSVAARVNFEDVAFIKVARKHFGVTPKGYQMGGRRGR